VLSGAEIARGTQGSLGFLQLDRTAPLQFDNTMAACLRSFRVMVLIAPLQLAALLLFYSRFSYTADDLEVAVVEVMHYVVDWLLFPVMFYEIARLLRLRSWLDNYPRYISALNWMNVPGMVMALAVMVVSLAVPGELAAIINLGFEVLIVYWYAATSRLALGVSWPISIVLAVVNYGASQLLLYVVKLILGIGGAGGA
jgi:hypothetical protein